MNLIDFTEYIRKTIYDNAEKNEDIGDIEKTFFMEAPQGNPKAKKYLMDKVRMLIYERNMDSEEVNELLYEYYSKISPEIKNFDDYSLDQNIDILTQIVYQEIWGMGVIDTLTDSPLDEIGVTRDDYIWIQDGGLKNRVDNLRFKDKEDLLNIINSKASSFNKLHDINTQKPYYFGERWDGSRITIAIPPLSKHPTLNQRKFILKELTEEEIIKKSSVTKELIEYFRRIYKGRPNILVIGEQGSGKSTMLKFLCRYIDDNLGIGTIERRFELNLDAQYPNKNIISLQETEDLDVEFLFELMLKQNRDIIIHGEIVTPKDASVAIKAMIRQAKGSSGTFHSSSPKNAVLDIRNLLMQLGSYFNENIALQDVIRAVDIIIQTRTNRKTGERWIERISEIVEDRDEERDKVGFEENVVFKFNKVTRKLEPTGNKHSDILIESLLDYEATEEDIAVINEILTGSKKEGDSIAR